MSLEQSITELTRASNQLMQTTTGYLNEMNEWRHEVANWRLDNSEYLEVGPKSQFKSVQSAWDSLLGKVISAPVIIKLADGTYEEHLWLANQPYAHWIRIEGNTLEPERCIFRPSKQANASLHQLLCINVQRLDLAGFVLDGDGLDLSAEFNPGLSLTDRSVVFLKPGTVKVQNYTLGAGLSHGSLLIADGIEVRDCTSALMVAGSHMSASNAVLKGTSATVGKPTGLGFFIYDNAIAYTKGMSVQGFDLGVSSRTSSYALCDEVSTEDCHVGFSAHLGSTLASSECQAMNCRTGFLCESNATLEAARSSVEACEYGYHANSKGYINAYQSSVSNTRYGYYASSMAQIEAYETQAKLVDVANPYSPPTYAIPGNDQAMIRFS